MNKSLQQPLEQLIRRQQHRLWKTALHPFVSTVISVCALLFAMLAIASLVTTSLSMMYPALIISLGALLFLCWQAIALHPSSGQACAQLDHQLNAHSLLISSREVLLRGEKSIVDRLVLQRAQQALPHWQQYFKTLPGSSLSPNPIILSMLVLSLLTVFLSAPTITTESPVTDDRHYAKEFRLQTQREQKLSDLFRNAPRQSPARNTAQSGNLSASKKSAENLNNGNHSQPADSTSLQAIKNTDDIFKNSRQKLAGSPSKQAARASAEQSNPQRNPSPLAQRINQDNLAEFKINAETTETTPAYDPSQAAAFATSPNSSNGQTLTLLPRKAISSRYSGTLLTIEQQLRVAAYFKQLENSPSQ